jgi:hypothetical protein
VIVEEEDEPPRWRQWVEAIFFPERGEVSYWSWGPRVAIWLGLTVWGLHFVRHGIDAEVANESFMHMINLVFHEAGHVLFAWLGRFMTILGGSLNQLLFPLICALTLLLRTRDAFGGSVGAWWLGQSLIDLAPYIDDARAQQLELLGGGNGRENGAHDWNNLLDMLGLLEWDHALAGATFALGAALILASSAWGATVLWRELRRLRDEAT